MTLPLEGAEAREVTLIGAYGSRHTLACSTGPLYLGTSVALWGIGPYSHTSSRVAGVPGQRVDDIHAEPRLIGLPIKVITSTPLELEQQLRSLGAILAPDKLVRIQFERVDGGIRELSAYCVDGQDQIAVADHEETTAEFRLVLKAFDPFWRSTSADQSQVSEQFIDAQSGGSNAIDIVNGSDVPEIWPEFTINGPIEMVQIGNHETGKAIIVHEVLTVADEVTIITDPTRRGAYLNGDRNWGVLDSFSTMWPLVPGLNRIVARGWAGGATPGSMTIRWAERYLTC